MKKHYYLSAVMFCFVLLSSCTKEDDLETKQINGIAQEELPEEDRRKGKIAGKTLNSDEILQLDNDIKSVIDSGKVSKSRKGFIAN